MLFELFRFIHSFQEYLFLNSDIKKYEKDQLMTTDRRVEYTSFMSEQCEHIPLIYYLWMTKRFVYVCVTSIATNTLWIIFNEISLICSSALSVCQFTY